MAELSYRIAADAVVVVHLAFVAFVVGGGLLALRWRWMPPLHVPAVVWAAALEFGGWICPLTPLEGWLRRAAGEAGYPGGFVDHYLLPVLYPEALTRPTQVGLGAVVIAVNLLAYGFVWARRR